MYYTILIYETPADFTALSDPENRQAHKAAWQPYLKALKDAGVFISGGRLQPPDMATTLRFQDGKRLVQNGPFADSKEQIGGFLIIDASDLDSALAWAARCPQMPGRILEIRPNIPQID